jgi:hypothetical protein
MVLFLVPILASFIILGCSTKIELGFWDGSKKYGEWQCVENSEPYKNKKCEEPKK